MTVHLKLTETQAEVLKDVLDAWIEGYEPATKEVELDPTFTDPEEMLIAIDGMHSGFADAVEIRMQLQEALSV